MMARSVLLFLYTLVPVVVFPALFPQWRLIFFAPFLIISYYNKSYVASLWLSLLCGVIIDLLSSHTPLGLHAINYCMTTWILYNQKRHFFEDSLTTIPILTFLFSGLSTLIQAVLMDFFDIPISFSWEWIKVDIFRMSLWDALYAFVWYTLPSLFLPKAPERREALFLRKIVDK